MAMTELVAREVVRGAVALRRRGVTGYTALRPIREDDDISGFPMHLVLTMKDAGA